MHKLFFFSRRMSLLCGAVILSMATAQAQVSTSSEALDHLQSATPSIPATGKPQSGSTTEQAPARPRRPAQTRTPAAPSAPAATQSGRQAPTATPAGNTPAAQGQGTAQSSPTGTAPARNNAAQSTTSPGTASQGTTGQGTAAQGNAAGSNAAPGGQNGGNQTTGTPKAAPPASTQPQRPAPPPTIPPAPPPEPQLTPAPPDVEIHPFPIPAQPAVELQAQGTVTAIPGGVRLTFAPGSAALNPETHQAILAFGQRLSDKPHIRAMIDAYSSGAANDPSLPRRMALARGLAARSVLMNGGTPSTRIYLRVIGEPPESKPGETQDYITIYESDVMP
ncbi:OmpA family protein [Acetobacter garciniae]|nr:hypothetical protein [Acetobacter garciniae]